MTSPENFAGDEKVQAGRPLFGRWALGVLLVGLLVVAGYVAWSRSTPAQPATAKLGAGPGRAAPVVAVSATQENVSVYLTGLGSVTPLQTVTVRTRVDGQLMQVLFREGQMVERGQALAEIDPRPFEALLLQAEGQLARDQALLANAQLDLTRYQALYQENGIAKQQLDTQEALIRQYEGVVRADQGQVDNAKVQLAYCHITAPLSGRIGLRLVDPGNVVHASDSNGLVVITQLQPIAVLFPVPEDSLPQVLARLRAGQHLTVDALDRAGEHQLASGELLTLDNQIDSATGTVRLKAVFANADHSLFPNQFVNARLLLTVLRGATVVPSAAIQRSPQGAYVYVVKADQTASMRPVTLGPSQGDLMAISAGLTPGELVVVDGADRLRDGAKVEVQAPRAPGPRRPGA